MSCFTRIFVSRPARPLLLLLRSTLSKVVGDDARDVREHRHERKPLARGKVLERGATVRLPLLTGPVGVLGVGERLLFELPREAVLAQPAGAQPFERAAVPEIEVAQAQVSREEPAEVEEELTGE